MDALPEVVRQAAIMKAQEMFSAQLAGDGIPLRSLFNAIAAYQQHEQSGWESDRGVGDMLRTGKAQIDRDNVRASWLRDHGLKDATWTNRNKYPALSSMAKSLGGEGLAKSVLDIGQATNFSQIVGGQSVGYMSLDTRLYRSTIRPSSFTLYNYLRKSQAFQVVDLWSTAAGTGGKPAGASYASFAGVTGSTLNTNAGEYFLNTLFLKLAVDARTITIPLAAQNNFVDIAAQETANAALSILQTINWANYWGNATLYPNQQQGLFQTISGATSGGNIWNFMTYTPPGAGSYTNQQLLFNFIYEICGQMAMQYTFSHITHAFMGPGAAADIQSLTTTLLNNLITLPSRTRVEGIVVNGDFNGMKTRFGEIQFPVDICIPMRNAPIAAYVNNAGVSQATTSAPTPPASVAATAITNYASGSYWWVSGGAFAPTSATTYVYAVASCDSSMNESNLTWTVSSSGIASAASSSGAIRLTITGPTAGDAATFRIYRGGLGLGVTGFANTVRWIGDVAANGSGTVTFTDGNGWIPGSETLFLLDLDDADAALDYRIMLPLVKVNLFAQNLYMPWAVAGIGAIRVTIPKFHAVITNYVPANPVFNPLQANYPSQGNWGGV